jgi:hypothetical protein
MKSILRLACLTALLPSTAFAQTPSLRAEPTTVDVYREMVRSRVAAVGAANALAYDTRKFQSLFLENPDSPYSNLRDDPPLTNEVWWYDFVDGLSITSNDKNASALAMLQWQGGFTKARIGVDVAIDGAAISGYRNGYAAANAVKAGVDADIFLKAWDMNGRMTTIAAGHAVALQLLREQVKSNAPDTYAAHGIDPGVLDRYLKQYFPDQIGESDLNYLAEILRHAISKRGFTVDSAGRRQLPAAYRVARVAAAYSDAAGYLNRNGYCAGNEPNSREPRGPEAEAYNRPLCFVAATDRAVQSWFRRQMRHEAALVKSAHASRDETATRLVNWFGTVLLLIDLAGFVEIGEAGLLGEMSTEGGLAEEEAAFAEERANQLTCRFLP